MLRERLRIWDDGIGQDSGQSFYQLEEEQFQSLVIVSIGKIVEE
jgi:hypothetical protein